MTKWKVLSNQDFSPVPNAAVMLDELGTLICVPPDRDTVFDLIKDCDAYIAHAKIMVDNNFLDQAPQLKVIGSPLTGTAHLDFDAIEQRGIELFTITREYDLLSGFTATSELVFGLLLALNRQIPEALQAANRGEWVGEKFTGFQLLGKTIGILGLGRLGKITARIAQGFGMNVIANDIEDISMPNVRMVSREDLFKESDVLSIHIHLNAETTGLVNYHLLQLMKSTAILINTSRGKIIDESALLAALEGDQLAGAGLDVIDGEWQDIEQTSNHALIRYASKSPNLLITPHIGGASHESIYGARVFMAKKIATFLHNYKPA
jgi:D-3-phosphoglycerate dehydrogenase / 2-oxoglutarate reductase